MKFLAKDMKKLTVVLKRIVTDKKKGMIQIKSNGDGILHISGENKFIAGYTNIPCEGTEAFSFRIPLYELDKWLTDNDKKKKEKFEYADWKINKKSMKETQTNLTLKADVVEWDETEQAELLAEGLNLPSKKEYEPKKYDFIPPSPWRYMDAEERFMRVLKEGYETIKKNTDIRTLFIALRSGKAMAIEERRTHLYRMDEEFPFENLYLHRDVLQVLSSTVKKGAIKHKKTTKSFHLQNGELLFSIQDNQKTVFPNLRKMVTKRKVFSFELNSVMVNDLLKTYKKEVTHVVVRFSDGQAHFIPNDENYATTSIPLLKEEGVTTECKFSTEVLKGLFGSFQEHVTVEHLEYRNVKQKEGYLWRVYKPEQLNIATGISRLDWDLLDKLHKEGKLKNISSLQELEELTEH